MDVCFTGSANDNILPRVAIKAYVCVCLASACLVCVRMQMWTYLNVIFSLCCVCYSDYRVSWLFRFERVPFHLQFSSGNFGETSGCQLGNVFLRVLQELSFVISSYQLGFPKEMDSVRRMLSVRWSKSENPIVIVPGLHRRLVAGKNAGRKINCYRKMVRFAIIVWRRWWILCFTS